MGLYYIYIYGTSNSNDNDNKDDNNNNNDTYTIYIYNIMYIIKRLKGSVICINKYVYNINNMFQPVQFQNIRKIM